MILQGAIGVIASLNINSLPAHIDEIKILLQEQNIHILALNETKIDADFPSELLKVEGYQFDRYDRNRNGGGVAFYIRDSLEVDIREDLPVSSLELRCIEVKPVRAKRFSLSPGIGLLPIEQKLSTNSKKF